MGFQYINKILAFLWLLIIGTNVAGYSSQEAAYQGFVILAGAVYFLFLYRYQALRLMLCKDYVLMFLILFVPVFLMVLSDRNFQRGDYTSMISIVLVFMVSSVMAVRKELAKTITVSVFLIVAIATATNLYELFVENNYWSIAPGRSAGLYINPTLSGEVLVGFALAFMFWRSGKLDFVDYSIIFLALIGVFSTFSRSAILACFVLFVFAIILRSKVKHFVQLFAGLFSIALVVSVLLIYVFQNIEFSSDAMVRITSMLEKGGIGDYRDSRGDIALYALNMALNEPLLGVGVRTIYEMIEGPHNMFVAMMVDYGVMGVLIYIYFIFRLVFVANGSGSELAVALWLFCGWLILFSFSSHNILGNTATMPLFGFVMARVYQIHALSRKQRAIL
jgi:hypothetical protein